MTIVYIGYDEKEDESYRVCRASLERRSSRELHIVKLDQQALRHAGLYKREWRYADGERIDSADGRPFSTDFTFTRFLVPTLTLYQGWALYCDCDLLWMADIAPLFELADDRYAVMCVKHDHDPHERIKMRGIKQTRYYRKNWSSVVLWNCGHPKNRLFLPNLVNAASGSWLHAFRWLDDEDIGEIPLKWNWLAGVNEPLDDTPCGIHFTLGVPTIPECEATPYAELWFAERESRRPAGRPLPSERLRAVS